MNNVTNNTTSLHPQQPPPGQNTTPFLCTLCPAPKYFTRKAHLERHIRTHHSVGSPLNCHFCSKEFRRSDLLKEHHIRCEFRGDRPIPVAIVGRKRRACDRCSQRKISCTGQIPCVRCINAGVVCEKTSPADTSQLWSSSSANSGTPPQQRGSVDSSNLEEEDGDGSGSDGSDDITGPEQGVLRGSIEYLLNGRSQGHTAFVRVFNPGEEEQPPPPPAETMTLPMNMPYEFDALMDFTQSLDYNAGYLPQYEVDTLFNHMGFTATVGLETNLWDTPWYVDQPSPAAATDLERYNQHADFLRPELQKMVPQFRLAEDSLELITAYDSIELINGETLQRFTNSYFRNWHRHGTMIHYPTYSPQSCPTMLILAMSLIGGLYMKDGVEIRRLKSILDIAEAWIYSRDYIRDEYDVYQSYPSSLPTGSNASKTYEDVDWEDFQKLQAAYLIIVIQAWAGDRVAKRRTRQQRLTRVLEIARQLQLPSAHHKSHPKSPEDWQHWVRVESAIRLQNIMLTIDRAFVIFNNTGARIPLAEVEQLDLPGFPACFNAASYEDMMMLGLPVVRNIKVMAVLRQSFVNPWPNMPNLTTFDMFILVHELYVCLAQDLSSQISPSVGSRAMMRHAIDWWIKHWKVVRARYSDSEFKGLGLERISDRYWVLVKALFLAFDKDIREGRRVPLGTRYDIDESGSHLKEFLGKRD